MEKKKTYFISEEQAKVLISEQLSDPNLMKMVGEKSDRAAFPQPVRTGVVGDDMKSTVGVGTKDQEPKPDLRALPKSPEIKQAYYHLGQAAKLVLNGAPKLNDDALRDRIKKLHSEINKIMMTLNAEINVNEVDLAG
jgi:hypothetical protein